MDFCFRPGMGARGLHLDIKRGWLMKVDSYHNIQIYRKVKKSLNKDSYIDSD